MKQKRANEIKLHPAYGSIDYRKFIEKNKIQFENKSDVLAYICHSGVYEETLIYFKYKPHRCIETLHLDNFLSKYGSFIKTKMPTKEIVWSLLSNSQKEKLPICCFEQNEPNDPSVDYEDFDWIYYLQIYPELLDSGINNKVFAWNHWVDYGQMEERAYCYLNNSNIHRGRFGNLFFINMFLHFYASDFDLKVSYKNEAMFYEMGIEFFHGKKTYEQNFLVTDSNFLMYFDATTKHLFEPANIIIHRDMWLQDSLFCLYLQKYFQQPEIKLKLLEANKFKKRIQKNNDLFLHIRLGDVTSFSESLFSYYDGVLSILKFDNGYISSDSINHDFCKYLIQKYKLKAFQKGEIETIMFANTCKHLILSGGTFSWLLGFFAQADANIFYFKYKNPWFGNIFDYNSKWICLND